MQKCLKTPKNSLKSTIHAATNIWRNKKNKILKKNKKNF